MNKRGMGMYSLVLLLLALCIGAAISAGDITPQRVDEIKENFTIDEINVSMPEVSPELENALNYYINGMLKAYQEITKWIMSYTAEHPEVPYKLLLILVILSILAPLSVGVIKILVIAFLLIKEIFQSRKEKKLIKSYKGGKK